MLRPSGVICHHGPRDNRLQLLAAGSSLTIRPLFITYILSLSPMISGSSDDTTITEIPCAAMSRMMVADFRLTDVDALRRLVQDQDPGSIASQRASSAFC